MSIIAPSKLDRLRLEPSTELDGIAADLLDAAIEVHRALGPGFLEAIDEEALCIELALRGVPLVRQSSVRVHYKGRLVGDARIDLLVADRLIVELKAVEHIAPIHLAQAMSYLRATKLPLALLINFNAPVLLRGVKRIILSKKTLVTLALLAAKNSGVLAAKTCPGGLLFLAASFRPGSKPLPPRSSDRRDRPPQSACTSP